MGSSPLARGLRLHLAEFGLDPRIIPARAGFTRPIGSAGGLGPDHPRSRGVYERHRVPVVAAAGSSPLARGLPPAPMRRRGSPRIIPARAGFTRHTMLRHAYHVDHPRSRGVYRTPSSAGVKTSGSSPLARGLPQSRCGSRQRPRIIPARAGFTVKQRRRIIPARDHPRSRGVYAACSAHLVMVVGSSPLARGLRLRGMAEG